ncbi:DUF6179 domain-containing protein [Clostridium sp. LBM24168]
MEESISFILQNLIKRYTKGKCSSLKEDTVFHMLNSIYYTIEAGKREKIYAEALYSSNLQDEFDLYNRGIKVIEKAVDECKLLYEDIKENRLDVPVLIYNNTIDNALPEFFKNYDIVFAAQDTVSSMDYPLTFDDMSIKGIFYIKQYLEKLKLETDFCRLFGDALVKKILLNYGIKYRADVFELPVNVFQVVFDQCFFLVLCGSSEKRTAVSIVEFNMVEKILSSKNQDELLNAADNVLKKIIDKYHIKDSLLVDYLNKYGNSFRIRFSKACSSGNLSSMVIVEEQESVEKKFIFQDGARMSNYEFNKVVDEISKSQDVKNKVAIIQENVHSLEDYIDILNSECFFGDEYSIVMRNADDIYLALLGANVFYDDLEDDDFKLSFEYLTNYRESFEDEWKNYYVDFLLVQKEERIENISKIIMDIHT